MVEVGFSYAYWIISYIFIVYDAAIQTIDDYNLWWLLKTLLFSMILPFLTYTIYFMTVLIVALSNLCRGRSRSEAGVSLSVYLVAAIWDIHSRIWHGHEVIGMENIPDNSPALLVFYHGLFPIDVYYLVSKVLLAKNILMTTVTDKFLFSFPGFNSYASEINAIPGSIQDCVAVLNKGSLLGIAPGGVYEAQFSENYALMWKNRLGFAKVSLEAKVPVIPIFTENIREAFVALPFARSFFLKLYSWWRLPWTVIFGEFPVKLRTFVGDPIPYEPITPEQLKAKVTNALNDMIKKHQRSPGSVTQAFLDRFRTLPLDKDVIKAKVS